MVRKATLTRAPLPGKGKGKGGCRGRKSPASASPEAHALELIAQTLRQQERYISFIAEYLRIAVYGASPVPTSPETSPKATVSFSPTLTITPNDTTQLPLFHPADDDRKEYIPSCEDMDEALAEHIFGSDE